MRIKATNLTNWKQGKPFIFDWFAVPLSQVTFFVSLGPNEKPQSLREYRNGTGGRLLPNENVTLFCAANGFPQPDFTLKIGFESLSELKISREFGSSIGNRSISYWASFSSIRFSRLGMQNLTCIASTVVKYIHVEIVGMKISTWELILFLR